MFFLLPATQTRPSILETNKDEKYHVDFARYCIGQSNNANHANWLEKVQKNKQFYVSDQWTDQEDIDTFLKDDTNNDRNRIALVDNIIKPMVIQFRGNAIRMTINFRAKSVSPLSINRREVKLAEQLFYSKVANETGNPFGEDMKKKLPIGNSEGETRAMFKNLYVDEYVKSMNNLCRFVSNRNKFPEKQDRLAEEMALTGLGVMKTFEYAGHQEFKIIPSENFFFDNSCREHDLSDAFYQGEVYELTPAEIFEMAPKLKLEDRKAIENYSQFYSGAGKATNIATNTSYNGRLPVFFAYWRDGQYDEFGYVKDKYGYDFFTRINYVYDGEEQPRYTDKDLIKSNSQRAKKLLGKDLKRTCYYDVLRMAAIIPREILGSAVEGETERQNITDVCLEWGKSPYQDCETHEYNSVKFPYKCYTWAFVNGEILSPVDDAIDPQRFLNRIFSVAQHQISSSRGSGTVYDKDMVEDEAQFLMDVNQSKPIGIRTKGMGVQNAIGSYDSTVKNGTQVLFNIMDATKNMVQKMTGVNDALKGESTGSDQLVGVTQLMIQRGSLMQEPFYNAITNIYRQCYDSICSVGKRIYCDNERNGAIAVGDDSLEVIKITKEMRSEDFRTFVKRENSDEMLSQAADQMLLTLKQLMLLDDKRFASLWGRSTPDDVAAALRAYASEKEELQRMSQQAAKQEEQQMMGMAQQEKAQQDEMMYEQAAREDIKDLTQIKADQTKEAMKNLGKLAGKSPIANTMILKDAQKAQNQNI